MKLLIVLSLLLGSCYAATLSRNYDNQVSLIPEYQLYWSIVGDSIQLGLQVNTTGWVGFAIGEPTSGSMPGADFLTGWVSDSDGSVSIQDRYSLLKAMPIIDDCAHWELISGQQTSDGQTIIEVDRKLVTGDPQDRPIGQGPVRILFAFGTSDVFQYHGTVNRHLSALQFLPSLQKPVNDTNGLTMDFRMNNFTIPATPTFYACQSFYLPADPNVPDNHIIRIEPLIDPATAQFIHHFVVQRCPESSSFTNQTSVFASSCDADPCYDYVWAWAPGMGALDLPPQAGFRTGGSASALKIVVLQIHYNNPSSIANQVDSSGFRITYTPILRQYDAGLLQLGDARVSAPSIPPMNPFNPYEFNCPYECSSLWPTDLTVFADFLHMHQIGKQMYTTHWRNGTYLGIINRVDFYQFALQQTTIVNLTIKAGDRLNTHCIYDSTTRNNITNFNLGSTDEMCIDFVYYYPALSSGLCGYVRNTQGPGNFTFCGVISNPAFGGAPILALTNPTISDPYVLPITFGNSFNGTCPNFQTVSQSLTKSSSVPYSSTETMKSFGLGLVSLLMLTLN